MDKCPLSGKENGECEHYCEGYCSKFNWSSVEELSNKIVGRCE